jgi:hypothetical protein
MAQQPGIRLGDFREALDAPGRQRECPRLSVIISIDPVPRPRSGRHLRFK